MLDKPRLDIERQASVGNAIAVAFAADRPTELLPGTRARGEALLTATHGIDVFAGATPAQVDRATGTALSAFGRGLEENERVLLDSVVPLGEPQREALAHIRLVRTQVFPHGTGFIRRTMDLEWPALRDVRGALQRPDVVAAIDALGLRPAADHLLAHIALYGRVIGNEAGAAGAAAQRASAVWHEAFKLFAAQVMVDYDKDADMQRELLGAYDVQLSQQRAAARAAVRARKAPAKSATPAAVAAPVTAPVTAPAPVTEPVTEPVTAPVTAPAPAPVPAPVTAPAPAGA